MRRSLALGAIVFLVAATLEAQTVHRPTRPYRGLFGGGPAPDPSRSRQELTLAASLLGGYDDQLSLEGAPGPLPPGQTRVEAYSGYVDLALHYFLGRVARSFSVDANGFTNAYNYAGADPTVGGAARLMAQTHLGRRNDISITQDFQYTPSLVLGAFETLSGDVNPQLLPEAGTGSGLVNQRSWAASTDMSLNRRWTTRQSTIVQGMFSRRTYLDELGYDTATRSAALRHRWSPSRTLGMGGGYHVSDSSAGSALGDVIPLQSHTFELSTDYNRRLSRTRQFALGGGMGATYVDTLDAADRQPQAYWMPSGHATLGVDAGRSWAVAADYRRSMSVLSGVTLESFATDAASVRANGTMGRRLETSLSASFSNGRSGSGTDPGRFESYSGLAQLRYAVSRCCAASLNYNYYYYRLRDFSSLGPGVPPEYDHYSVRVGFNFWLPLFGSSVGNGGRAESPRER